MAKQNNSQPFDHSRLSLVLPRSLDRRIERIAFLEDRSKISIVIDALEQYLPRVEAALREASQ